MASFEFSLVARSAFAEGAYGILVELMKWKGWSPAELEQRIDWTEGRFGKKRLEEWLTDPEKRPEDCCVVVFEAMKAGLGSKLGEPSHHPLSPDLVGKLYSSSPPDGYPMGSAPDFDVCEPLRDDGASPIRLLHIAMGAILELVIRQPDRADSVIESIRIFLRQLYDVTGKDPDGIRGSGSSRRS